MAGPSKRHAKSAPPGERAGKAKNIDQDDSRLFSQVPQARSTYKRWNKKGLGKITDFDKVPKGWDWHDYDIHEELVLLSSFYLENSFEYPSFSS